MRCVPAGKWRKLPIGRLRELRRRIEETKVEIEKAERQYDLNRVAELKYGTLAQLERELAAEEEQLTKKEGATRLIKEEVDEDDVAEVVARWTRIPVTKLLEGEMQKLLHLEEHLHKRVIGQDEAVTAVADAVIRARAGIKDPNRPIGSFIFLGPTGVGKTELGRALAEFLFDDEAAVVAHRHVRVHGEAHRGPLDRRAAGLRRLRGRWAAHGSGAPPPVLRSSCSTRSRRRITTSST